MGEGKGFAYIYTKEKYETYKELPAWQKLAWLEKMNYFLYNFMPLKSKELAERMRKGEI